MIYEKDFYVNLYFILNVEMGRIRDYFGIKVLFENSLWLQGNFVVLCNVENDQRKNVLFF